MILDRFVKGVEERTLTSGLAEPNPWLSDALALSTNSYSGRHVGVDTSMRLVPVYSAVSLLAGSVGSLPLIVYERTDDDGGRKRASQHRTWSLLHDQPNPEMAADELWEIVATHLLLWGNAFVAKIRDSLGIVRELWPLRPNRVMVGRDERGRFFTLDGANDKLRETDILHIRGLGTDGLVGLSPIQQARQVLGSTMEMEEFTGRFWGNAAMPSGILRHPNKFQNPDAAQRLKDDFKSVTSGVRRGGIALLEEDMDFKQIGLPMDDAQFIETQHFNQLQIALLFRIPPRMLGTKTGDSLTYATQEQESIDFVTHSLRRWLVRIEGSLVRDPSIYTQGQRFFPEFLIDALLRSSTKERYDSYAVALDPVKGWMHRSEVRDRENLGAEDPADIPKPPAPPAPDPGANQ